MPERPAFREDAFERVLARWNRSDQPGLVAALRSDQGWLWRKAVGLADVQAQLANGLSTRFRVGSITKQFLCAVVFDMAERGQLDLSWSVRRLLPELPVSFGPVSLLNLTDHTSGIWCHISTGLLINGRGRYPPPSNREVFEQVAAQKMLAFEPGVRLSYSNGGSVLLTAIVERLLDTPLEDIFRQRLFLPIGMAQTALVRRDSELAAGLAALHVPLERGEFERGYMPFPMGGEGGAVSTVDDMLTWLAHLDDPTVFSRSVVERMQEPVRLPNGFEANFGRGMIHGRHRGHEMIFHDGGVIGGLARAARLPNLGLHLVVLTNRSDASLNEVSRGLLDACIGYEPEQAGLPGDQIPEATYFRAGVPRTYRFETVDGRPIVDIAGMAVPVVRDGQAGFRCDTTETADLRFRVSDDGSTLVVNDRGEAAEYHRAAEESAIDDAEAASLAGRFECEETSAHAVITTGDGSPRLHMTGMLGARSYTLNKEAPDTWRATPTDPPASRPIEPILAVVSGSGFTGFRIGDFRVALSFRRAGT